MDLYIDFAIGGGVELVVVVMGDGIRKGGKDVGRSKDDDMEIHRGGVRESMSS
jgi:hypothetical protein